MSKSPSSCEKRPLRVLLAILIAALVILIVMATWNTEKKLPLFEGEKDRQDTNTSEVLPADQGLMAVIATNGEKGYVYYDDYYAASGFSLKPGSDEALDRQKKREKKIADAFKEAINEYCKQELFNSEVIEQSLSSLNTTNGMKGALDVLKDYAESKDDEFPNGSLMLIEQMSESDFRLLYDKARMHVGVKLPVFKKDGITPIGEFLVDAV